MYTSENHFNSKASDCAIEEVYTNLDIGDNCEYDPRIGYSFYYPYRFVNDPAQLKAVGIRRLNIIPTKHTITYRIVIQPIDKEEGTGEEGGTGEEEGTGEEGGTVEEEGTGEKKVRPAGDNSDGNYRYSSQIDVTSANNLLEIINEMCETINIGMAKNYGENFMHKLLYRYVDNVLTLYVTDVKNKIYGKLKIMGDDEFYKFLNQPIKGITSSKVSTKTIEDDFDFKDEYAFSNVWDRSYIEFHASFSDSNRNFIGRNNTFYSRPSLFYLIPSNSFGFNIRFTNDGLKPVLPRYCRFIVQLCFVLNYKMFRI